MNRLSKIIIAMVAALGCIGGAAQAASVMTVPSVAAMQALGTVAPTYQTVQTTSYHAGLAIGGATYIWNATSVANDCAHVAVSGVTTGRYVLRWGLQGNQIFPEQCGAYFDNIHDDAVYWNATEIAAAAYGLVIGPTPGTSGIGSMITPGAGVIHKFAGPGVEVLNCTNTTQPCFYLQNSNGTGIVQAPQFYNGTILCSSSAGSSVPCIQYNSIAGGFTDDGSSQAYMWQPVVQNMTISNGGMGIQCSKCFEGTLDGNYIHGQSGIGIDLEGTDWTEVSNNRIQNTTGIPIYLIAHGTFGNGAAVLHNDLLIPQSAVNAYIYSTYRSVDIEFNGIEGTTNGACNINLAAGFTAVVRNNLVQDITTGRTLCFVGDGAGWYQLDASNNALANSGATVLFSPGKLPFFIPGSNGIRTHVTHSGNINEGGFPFNTQSSMSIPLGGKTIASFTPDSALNINSNDYGAMVSIEDDGSYILPPGAGQINFYNMPYTVVGAIDVCITAKASNSSNTIVVQFLDGGVSTHTETITVGAAAAMYCPAGLANLVPATAATFNVRNDDVGDGGTDFLYSLVVLKH